MRKSAFTMILAAVFVLALGSPLFAAEPPSYTGRLTEAEAKIAALEAKVDRLETALGLKANAAATVPAAAVSNFAGFTSAPVTYAPGWDGGGQWGASGFSSSTTTATACSGPGCSGGQQQRAGLFGRIFRR